MEGGAALLHWHSEKQAEEGNKCKQRRLQLGLEKKQWRQRQTDKTATEANADKGKQDKTEQAEQQ